MAPKTKARKNPWDSNKGKAVHPMAPAGGGGPGGFAPKVPLNRDRDAKRPLPDPQSPVGRNTAPIDPPRDTSVPPPPSLDMGALMATRARELIDKPVIHDPLNGDRAECFDMVDKMLTDLGAKSARDFMKSVGENDNYVWGPKEIKTDKIQPGDIVQIRDSELNLNLKITYTGKGMDHAKYPTKETNTSLKRGHHTAVVIGVNADGSLEVVEQHLTDHQTGKLIPFIRQNTFPLKDTTASETRKFSSNNVQMEETTTKTWTVKKGRLWVYRPVEKK
jgi:hypothetical protein